MPAGATHPMHSSKGHIVRIFWDNSFNKVYQNFYQLMREEANPVSMCGENKISQIPFVYYWNGAAVTYSERTRGNKRDKGIVEIQHTDKKTLDSLVGQMVDKLKDGTKKAKFNYRTIIGDIERAENKNK